MRRADRVQLYSGFPMANQDYAPLVRAVEEFMPGKEVVLAHSHGALVALASTPPDISLVLLAPSDPRRPRPGRSLSAWLLRTLSVLPRVNPWLAEALRRRSFAAMGVAPPAGPPLSLADAARRLRVKGVDVRPRAEVLVITSPSDPRHQEQLELARDLGATVRLVEGGHMFPLTDPVDTARVISDRLSRR
ncbi:alpha/beta fold hydrolase [Luteococcus sp.]|uniref:alpha/beta fold hydrolase n=1 Tax=Luteococcus sp. TaxID=1969402 RepID=UPI003735A861